MPRIRIISPQFATVALSALLFSCAQITPRPLTDLAIDDFRPPENASRQAEIHAKRYWAKHQGELGLQARYLAVESYPVDAGDIPDLYGKLVISPGVNSADLEDYETNSDIDISCVNIFDTRLGRLVSNDGFAVVDLPARGRLARFGQYTAIFVGYGN
jgi:hypothetical protein